MRNRNKTFVIKSLDFASLFLICSLLLVSIIVNDIGLKKILFCIISLFTASYIMAKTKSFYHPLFLFYIAFFYFIGGSVFLDVLFPNYNFAKTHFFTNYEFSKDIQNEMLLLINFVQFGILLASFSIKERIGKYEVIHNIRLRQYFYLVFILAFFIKLISIFLIINQVFKYGYISLYLKPIVLPPFIRMGDDLFIPSIACLLAFQLEKKQIKSVVFALILIGIAGLLTGNRSSGIGFLLLSIVVKNIYEPMKNRYFAVVFIFLLFLILLVQVLRIGEKIEISDLLGDIVGSIVPTIGYGIQYKNEFNDSFLLIINFIVNYIDYFLRIFTGISILPNFPSGPSSMLALEGHDSAARISYFANSQYYLGGMGMGTSAYLEYFWLGGLISVIVLTFVNLKFMLHLYENYNRSIHCRFFFIIFLNGWFLSNRTSALEYLNIFYLVKFIPIVLLTLILFYYMNRRCNMKRVLFSIFNFGSGGAEHVLLNILKHNKDSSQPWDVTVFVEDDVGVLREEYIKYATILTVKTPKIKFLDRILKRIVLNSSFLMNFFVFKGREYDISVAYLEGGPAKIVKNIRKTKKKIAWIHTDISCFSDKIRKKYRNIYNSYEHIYFVSQSIKDKFLMVYPEISCADLSVVYNPINFEVIKSKSEEFVVANDNKKFNVITVGRFSQEKGIDRVIEIAYILKCSNIHFTLIGNGVNFDELKQKAIGLENVTFLGYQKNPFPYILSSDLYLLPSRREGYPTCLCEALALGKPIISSDCTGAREVLVDSGIILPNEDSEFIKQAVCMLRELSENKDKYEKIKKISVKRASEFDYKLDMDLLRNYVMKL